MPNQNNPDSSHLERHLADAQTRAEKGDYADAVRAVREAKALAPKNVYVLAFEKQAEQLSELESAHSLTEEQRTDILESIPAIIERAIESSRSPGTLTDISALKSGPDATQERKEKAAALEWLKDQYFQHAHEYIRKGEYQNALAEIRRVYIIDPTNAIAREFEKEFETLAQLKRGDSVRVYPTVPSVPPPPRVSAPAPTSEPRSEGRQEAPDSTPMMTEEWSSPQQLRREAPHPPRIPEKKREKKNGAILLVVLIVIALGILAAVVYIYYQRTVYKKPQPASLSPSSSEQFIGAPAQSAEHNYMVSGNDSTQGTPQVTELAVSDTQGPASKAAEKKTPVTPGGGQTRDNPERSFTPPVSEEVESTPPVMASQAQPGLKQPVVQPKTEDTATPAPFVAIQKEARIIRLVKPTITAQGFLTGIRGQVVIQVRIDATGKPVQTVTLKSTNDLLIQPVIDAVMSSQFAPAEMTTGPVASWLTIPFKFASK